MAPAVAHGGHSIRVSCCGLFLGIIFLVLGVVSSDAYSSLDEAYSAMGFDPGHTNNGVVVFLSDTHMSLDFNVLPVVTNLEQRLVNTVNGMDPAPDKIFVSGDVSTALSPIPGWRSRGWSENYGTNEMIHWQSSIDSFTNVSETNIVWVPGNHDQLHSETNAETFRLMFPQMPTRQTLDVAGMRFFFLNCGNFGGVDVAQAEWLREELSKTSPDQPVALVTHVPPFLNPPIYRALALDLREIFEDWPERWWTLSGHYHSRSQRVYDIGQSNVAQFVVGTANTKMFNGLSDDAGCAFLCLSNGIAGIVYYHYNDESFEVAPPPDWTNAQPFRAAFEDTPRLLWRRLKSRTPAPEVTHYTGDDAVDWYTYVKELQWNISLGFHSNQATHFLLLGIDLETSGQLSFSADSNLWEEVPLPTRTNGIYSFPIPTPMVSLPNLFVRLTGSNGTTIVSGWGLATTSSWPQVTYPQLVQQPSQEAYVGELLTVTNQVISPYSPPDPLEFSLLTGPEGATVDEETGVFAWTAPVEATGQIIPVVVKVEDRGTPVMSATNQFLVSVVEGSSVARVAIQSIHVQPGSVTLEWVAPVTSQFAVDYTDALPGGWTRVSGTPITSTNGRFIFTDEGTLTGGLSGMRYYRVVRFQ